MLCAAVNHPVFNLCYPFKNKSGAETVEVCI